MIVNDNELSVKLDIDYIYKNSETKLVSYIIFEFTPIANMDNTKVKANVYGTAVESAVKTISAFVIIIILLPFIICISIIICIICCVCKRSQPIYNVPNNQPLYPIQQQQQQTYQPTPGYVPPY